MAKEPLTIAVDPASELARALADEVAPVVLDSDGCATPSLARTCSPATTRG